MYGVQWDAETGGILLCDSGGQAVSGEIRPVFFEELDMLGLDRHWNYDRSEAPLLWADGRRYYYRGQRVLEVKGGGFFSAPNVNVLQERLSLAPVDVQAMVERNASVMEGLEFRAIEFVHEQHERWSGGVDVVGVAFSGGKDSLVTLDLTQRALPPDEFIVVFDDTMMELSTTYAVKERVKQRWPQLRMEEARCHMDASETWQAFGPPSRMHRWCCAVHKSAPTLLLLRKLAGKPSARVLVFDGVRRGESQRRSAYDKSTVGGKHATQINASPVLNWSYAEIVVYVLARGLAPMLNESYRHGLPRVGCAICPYSSSWDEYVIWTRYSGEVDRLMSHLRAYSERECGMGKGAEAYIRDGRWKMRGGGRVLANGGNRMFDAERGSDMSFQMKDPTESWEEWAKAVGRLRREGPDRGSIEREGILYAYRIERHGRGVEVTVSGTDRADRFVKRDLRSVAYKAAYCVHCRACEVECPTGALSINGRAEIDEEMCVHCGHCLSFVDKGCWAAKSLTVSTKGTGMKGINAYQTFGMSREWLAEYFRDPEAWWHKNTLGPRQFDAMKVWLQQAEIVDRRQTRITDLGSKVLSRGVHDWLSWAVIWTNLARNSVLIKWYVQNVPFGQPHTKHDLVDLMGDSLAERTRANAVTSLIRLLTDTPLGNDMGLGHAVSRGSARNRAIVKHGVQGLPQLGLLYCLYRYAEETDRYSLSLEELSANSSSGPRALFGTGQDELVSSLRGLASRHGKWIQVELVRDLDNIYLERSCSAARVLDIE